MANITTTEAANSLATIVASEALGRWASNSILSRLVARDWDNEVATYGQAVQIPVRGAVTVADKSANTDYALVAPSDSAITVTLDKHKSVAFIIEDLARALSRPDLMLGYIDDAAIALAEQVDSDIAALYSGLSQTSNASGANGPLDYTDFIYARKVLSVAKAPMVNRSAVLHPTAAAELLADVRFTNRDYRGPVEESALKTGFLGEFAGFTCYEDQNIRESASLQKNLFIHRDAFVLVTRPLPAPDAGTGVITKVMDENGVGIRVMISYNHLKGGHVVTLDCLYGVAELRDAAGVMIETD
jgi:hypothetical protein